MSSRRNAHRNGDDQPLELKLNLSPSHVPPRRRGSSSGIAIRRQPQHQHQQQQLAAAQSPETSPPRSCLSSEDSLKYSSSPDSATATSMVLAGCPRCLMYVMLSELDPRCPKCKSPVLLDFSNFNR